MAIASAAQPSSIRCSEHLLAKYDILKISPCAATFNLLGIKVGLEELEHGRISIAHKEGRIDVDGDAMDLTTKGRLLTDAQ